LVQAKPEGIAQAFLVGRDSSAEERVALVLGDNIFYATTSPDLLKRAAARDKAHGVAIRWPTRSATALSNSTARGKALASERSPAAEVPVCRHRPYFLRWQDCGHRFEAKPSARGELEITDVKRATSSARAWEVIPMGRGMVWLDQARTSPSSSAQFIETIERRQGLKMPARKRSPIGWATSCAATGKALRSRWRRALRRTLRCFGAVSDEGHRTKFPSPDPGAKGI